VCQRERQSSAYLDAGAFASLLSADWNQRHGAAQQKEGFMATSAVSDSTFETEVKKAELPVLVDFWAEWCGPCRMVGPILEELSEEFAGQIKIVKLDVESNPSVAQTYNIRGIPALLLFKNGEVAGQQIGALPKHQLRAWISEAVASS
jgi:thioredoxin 1